MLPSSPLPLRLPVVSFAPCGRSHSPCLPHTGMARLGRVFCLQVAGLLAAFLLFRHLLAEVSLTSLAERAVHPAAEVLEEAYDAGRPEIARMLGGLAGGAAGENEDLRRAYVKRPTPPRKPLPLGTSFWIHCAAQWQQCRCQGPVRWGNGDTWKEYHPETPGGVLDMACSVQTLPDVLPGDDSKHCECKVRDLRCVQLAPWTINWRRLEIFAL